MIASNKTIVICNVRVGGRVWGGGMGESVTLFLKKKSSVLSCLKVNLS